MSQPNRQQLEEQLKAYVGIATGEPTVAPQSVNAAMIQHWCDAMGDTNPIYTDESAARAAGHNSIVAPPTMMQAWVLSGIEMADPSIESTDKQAELHKLLTNAGYPGVVATNCDQGYTRYLKPGDRVSVTTMIEGISEQKATGLGVGYFINTRDIFKDQDGLEVAWMTFRVLKFKPHEQPEAVADSDDTAEPAKPTRLAAPRGHDNAWWWEGVDKDKLLIQKCSNCSELRHPPRPMCASCQSIDWQSVEASGRATVYSFVVLHYPKFPGYDYPFVSALIELEEGTRLVSNVVGCRPDQVSIGMKVELVFEAPDGSTKLPVFRPAN